MNIYFYQGHFPVGAIADNAKKMRGVAEEALHRGAELIVFPELALSGYPPEDLLFQQKFQAGIEAAIAQLQQDLPPEILVILGAPVYRDGKIYNALLAFGEGRIVYEYHKQALPNFGVFDDQRYFSAGSTPGVLTWKGHRIGLLICEDLWHSESVKSLGQVDVVISIHASPFERGKRAKRLQIAMDAYQILKAPIVYVHQIGVQDEVIYDGGSFCIDAQGGVTGFPQFEAGLFCCFAPGAKGSPSTLTLLRKGGGESATIYQALCFALKGYVDHHGFPGVLLGLSGGIDSALTLAIAVDALGADRVQAVLMPSRYTAAMSIEDAEYEAKALGVSYSIIPIETLFEAFIKAVSPHFSRPEPDLTEENIQARLRGMILMALSNKSGKMVVTTTNKSELAVGYGTLYGDLAGGFALLKDVYKTEVYALARHRNTLGFVIPERVLTRPPSAELRHNQTDQDALPDYVVLDDVIERYMAGEPDLNPQMTALIRRNEYKRKQAPLGPKVSARAFGKDWRMPIMQGK